MLESNNTQNEKVQDVEFIKDQNNTSTKTENLNKEEKNDTRSKIKGVLNQYNFNTDPNKLPKASPKHKMSILFAILVHLSMIFTFTPVFPLLVFLFKENDQFAVENAKEDLNLYITYLLVNIALIAIFYFTGLSVMPLYIISVLVVIYACVQTYQGKIARIPYIFRIIS